MRNFQMIAAGVDVLPLLHAITRQPELWNQNRLRTTYPETPHAEFDDFDEEYGGSGAPDDGFDDEGPEGGWT